MAVLIQASKEVLKLETSIHIEFLDIPIIYQDLGIETWLKYI